MKSIRKIIKEEERTRTKQKTEFGNSFDHLFKDKELPAGSQTDDKTDSSAEQKKTTDFRKSSQANTLSKTANIDFPDDAADLLSGMKDISSEVDIDVGEYHEPKITTDVSVDVRTLPAVASKSLQAAGLQSPEFHQVASLPGNMLRAIRALGKSVFNTFTKTPTEDIWMVADFGGMGPNTTAEVRAVAGWARDNGIDLGSGDIDFDETIPGYEAKIHQYSVDGIRVFLVRDSFGDYIYTWPESDSKSLEQQKMIDR